LVVALLAGCENRQSGLIGAGNSDAKSGGSNTGGVITDPLVCLGGATGEDAVAGKFQWRCPTQTREAVGIAAHHLL